MKLEDLVVLEQEIDPVETARNNLAAAKENLKTLTAQKAALDAQMREAQSQIVAATSAGQNAQKAAAEKQNIRVAAAGPATPTTGGTPQMPTMPTTGTT